MHRDWAIVYNDATKKEKEEKNERSSFPISPNPLVLPALFDTLYDFCHWLDITRNFNTPYFDFSKNLLLLFFSVYGLIFFPSRMLGKG